MNITGLSGTYQGRSIPLTGSVVFGRNPQSCTVLFPDNVKGISRIHCRIDQISSSNCTLTDTGSSWGTFLNGQRLQPNVPVNLKQGDTFWQEDNSNMFSVSGSGMMNGYTGKVAQFAPKGMSKGSKWIIAAAVIIIVVLSLFLVRSHNLEEIRKQEQQVQEMERQRLEDKLDREREARYQQEQERLNQELNKTPGRKILEGVVDFFD